MTNVYSTLENGKIVGKIDGIVASGEAQTFTGDISTVSAGKVYEYTTNPAGVTTFASISNTAVDGVKTVMVTSGNFAKTALTVTVGTGSTKCYFDTNVKYIYWGGTPAKATVLTGKQTVSASTDKPLYFVVTEKAGTKYVSAIFVSDAPADDTTVTSADILFIAAKNPGTTTIVDGASTKTLHSYVAYIGGELVDEFYSEDDVSSALGFYKNVKDSKTGAYVLTGNTYGETTGASAVLANKAVTANAAGVLTADSKDFDISTAKVVDLTTAEEGITTSAYVYVVYNAQTMVASTVYVVDAP